MALLSRVIQQWGYRDEQYDVRFPFDIHNICTDLIESEFIPNASNLRNLIDELKAREFINKLIADIQTRYAENQRNNLVNNWMETIQVQNMHILVYQNMRDVISQQIYFYEPVIIDINDQLYMLQQETDRQKQNVNYPGLVDPYNLQNFVQNQFVPEQNINTSNSFTSSIDFIEKAQIKILQELDRWKHDQVLIANGIGRKQIITLDHLQNWINKLIDFILSTRNSITVFYTNNAFMPNMDQLQLQLSKLTDLQRKLMCQALVVVNLPQVLQKNKNFKATIRYLITNQVRNIPAPQVTASMISEPEARLQYENYQHDAAKAGIMQNANGTLMLKHSKINSLECSLKLLKLTVFERKAIRGGAADEKFAIHFKTTIECAELTMPVWVISPPVVVVVHCNQEPQAWATITWDNAFSRIGRLPFVVEHPTDWYSVATMLNAKFLSQTGRGLSDDNMQYLRHKFYEHNASENQSDYMWERFCKKPLPNRDFTFWEWFYAIMKLTRDHLRNVWQDGLILGFTSKQDTERRLLQCNIGTFLLRFSDSELGGITISYTTVYNREYTVKAVQPLNHKHLAIHPLSDCIRGVNFFVTLYPDRAKDEAFQRHYRQAARERGPGYVPAAIIIVVDPGVVDAGVVDFNGGLPPP